MNSKTLLFILIVFTTSAFAQSQSGDTDGQLQNRKMLLKKMVAQDRGEITVIEPSSREDGSVVIGYSSGDVVVCDSELRCREFSDTPSMSVEHLAVSRNGASEIVWVTYRHGAFYQCANGQCKKFMQP